MTLARGSAPPTGPTGPALAPALGLVEATALNMTNMVGVGPFITIPLILAAMNGPQAMVGWVLGALIACADGLVWAELGSQFPGSGGSFLYLREAFGRAHLGRLMAFLFIWQFVLTGPLEIASGAIGFTAYARYFVPGVGDAGGRLLSAAVAVLATVLLYRPARSAGAITVTLWCGMLLAVGLVLVAGAWRFDARQAFTFPAGAFRLTPAFWSGLGAAMLIAMYDFLGYYDVCFVGDEVMDAPRVIPRSILVSVAAVAAIYLFMNISIISVIPWREAIGLPYVASVFMERVWGRPAASVLTGLVLVTTFASIYALLLGYSHIPFAAARDGYFFRAFGQVHPAGRFPTVSLLVLGAVSAVGSLANLSVVISALVTLRIGVQFLGQIVGVVLLRRSGRPRPFSQWLYPAPAVVAAAGWTYILVTAGARYLVAGALTAAAGIAAYLVWARRCRYWPYDAAHAA